MQLQIASGITRTGRLPSSAGVVPLRSLNNAFLPLSSRCWLYTPTNVVTRQRRRRVVRINREATETATMNGNHDCMTSLADVVWQAVASTRVQCWGDEPCEPTVRLPDWSELVASYTSRMKSAWGWANGGQPTLVCYIRKYVIILGGYSRWRPPNQNIGGRAYSKEFFRGAQFQKFLYDVLH